MKYLLPILLAGALCAQTPRGHWGGVVEIPGHPLAVELDLDLAANMWIGSVSLPDRGISGAALENIAFVNGRWTFRIKGSAGGPAWVGTVSPDGTLLTGDYTEGSGRYRFKLLHSGDAQVDLPKSSPALPDAFLGTWEGALYFGPRPLHLVLKVANDEAGAKALLISVDQGGSEIPVTAVEQDGAKLDLQITVIGSAWKGEINKDGTVLTGAWTQASAQPMPLVFRKAPRL